MKEKRKDGVIRSLAQRGMDNFAINIQHPSHFYFFIIIDYINNPSLVPISSLSVQQGTLTDSPTMSILVSTLTRWSVTLIRNATCLIAFGGKRWLLDPMLAEQGTYPAFTNTTHADRRNPLVPLPLPLSDLLNIDTVIVTHTHTDHRDAIAAQHIPKEIPIFVQHAQNADIVRQSGFHHVHVLSETSQFADIRLFKTAGQHGSDEALAEPVLRQRLGDVCGVVVMHPTEQTL